MKSSVTNIALSILLAGAATFASTVSASPMSLELNFQTGNFASLFPEGSDVMRIHYDNGPDATGTRPRTQKSVTVAAGMFSGSAVEGANTTINTDTLFTDPDNVLAYCVDILNTLLDGAVYTLEEISRPQVHTDDAGVTRNFGRLLSFLGAVNQVQQDSHGFAVDSKNWLRPNEPWMSGAIQLGIWESLYESSSATNLSVDPGTGTQWFWTDFNSVHQKGRAFLGDVFTLVNGGGVYTPVDASEVLWAVTESGQDLIIDPVDVPVPATGLLLLGGIGALAWRRRTARG